MKFRTPAVVKSFLVFILALFVSLGLAEILARILVKAPPPPHAEYRKQHPQTIFANKETREAVIPLESYGAHHDSPEGKTEFRISISSQGLRDREFGPKSEGEYRILFLGDSFTFGYGVENNETIPKRLESLLGEFRGDDRITVINAGVEGFGPWQERSFLREAGFSLQPDIVILQLFSGNDLYDSLNQVNKHFRAYHRASLERLAAFRNQHIPIVRLQRWLHNHCRVYQLIVKATKRENALIDLLESLHVVRKVSPPSLPPPENRYAEIETDLIEWYPELEEAWELFERDVLGIAEDCHKEGVRFLACCVPHMATLYDPYWRLYTDAAGGESIYDRGKTVRLIEQFFSEKNLSFVTLLPCLAREQDKLDVYFQFNKHLTPKGCNIVASEIMNFLKGSGWLP